MSTSQELAARIGLDWADQQHEICLEEAGSARVERMQLPQSPEAIAEWVAALRQRFGGRPVGICLETTRGPVVSALREHEFLVLYPVNPRSLRRFREAFSCSGAKDDPDDAGLLLEMLSKHEERLHPWQPDDGPTRALRRLVEARRKAVDLRTQLVQQLTAELKGYFPQALGWAGGDLSGRLATDFLLRWPTLEALQRARAQTVRRFYSAHNCRRGDLIEPRLQEMQGARPLWTDAAIVETSVLTVQTLARQLQTLGKSITRYDEEIAARFAAHPDAALLESLPGAGAALAPRLLSALGSNRDRFADAEEVQKTSGIAPITKTSGTSLQVPWRWAASKFVRQSFHEFARQSIHRSAWARAQYEQQRERGHKRHAAIRSLAFKWIRILYRCWKDATPYDEARYLEALRRRRSPWVERLASPAAA